MKVKLKDNNIHLPEGVYFCGQITQALSLNILSETKATMIQLFPWTPAWFGISNAYLFTDKICRANEVINFKELNFDVLIGLKNEIVCIYLAKIFSPLFRRSPNIELISKSIQLILDDRGNITVASVARSMKCSERHLQKLFQSFIGINPKLFINIIKLREALDHIVYPNDKPETMTRLALTNGYYDQPHFNNAFSSFVGKTPKKFDEKEFFLTIKK